MFTRPHAASPPSGASITKPMRSLPRRSLTSLVDSSAQVGVGLAPTALYMSAPRWTISAASSGTASRGLGTSAPEDGDRDVRDRQSGDRPVLPGDRRLLAAHLRDRGDGEREHELEIGRASCRERGERSGGAAGVSNEGEASA